MRAATELGLRTVAIYSQEDRFSLHRTKSDESYLVGEGKGPIEAYLDIADILRIAREARVDAIHPGYGFLVREPRVRGGLRRRGPHLHRPHARTPCACSATRSQARNLAVSAGVRRDAGDAAAACGRGRGARLAREVGYPVMLKASWGGGGRGMRVVERRRAAHRDRCRGAARGQGRVRQRRGLPGEAGAARAPRRGADPRRHARQPGASVSSATARCSGATRRWSSAPRRCSLTDAQRSELCAAALKIGRAANYRDAGTVEFLQDADTGKFYFIEVNPRIQVEHTVTECATGIDLVKAQIRIAGGARIGTPGERRAAAGGDPGQSRTRCNAA